MSSSPSRRIQTGSPGADHWTVNSVPEQKVPRPRPRSSGGGPGGLASSPALVVLPVVAVVAVVVAAVVGTATVALVVALVAALAVAGVLAAALAVSSRGHRDAARHIDSLLCALETAREGIVSDEVTGLLNRRGLLLVGKQVLESARRSGGAVHACVVEVSPALHLGGDPVSAEEVLTQHEEEWTAAAAALRAATRNADVVAREEGGRFIVLGPGAGLHAQELERRLRVGLAQSRLAGGGDRGSRMSVEVGAAVMAPWDDGGIDDLLVHAEQAFAQRRALRRSAPQHGWGRRRSDRGARGEHPQT